MFVPAGPSHRCPHCRRAPLLQSNWLTRTVLFNNRFLYDRRALTLARQLSGIRRLRWAPLLRSLPACVLSAPPAVCRPSATQPHPPAHPPTVPSHPLLPFRSSLIEDGTGKSLTKNMKSRVWPYDMVDGISLNCGP